MTNDYKNGILDYITNNVTVQTGSNIPVFSAGVSVTGNVKNTVTTKLSGAQAINLIGSLTNELNSNVLFYGFYETTDTKYYGFIYMVDENMEELSFITTFSSGSYLFPIISLNQDENNYIYGLSLDYEDLTKGRVVLLNNIFSSENNKVVLRSSYLIPNNYEYQKYNQKQILKVPGDAQYFVVAQEQNSSTKIIRFTINVGSDNEWVVFDLDPDVANIVNYDVIIEKNGDTIIYHLYTILYTQATLTYDSYAEYKIENDTPSRTKFITFDYDFFLNSACVLANSTSEVYVGTYTSGDKYLRIKKLATNSFNQIFSYQNSNASYLGIMTLKSINGIVVAHFSYYVGSTRYCRVGILCNDTLYYSNRTTSQSYSSLGNYASLVLQLSFNLLKIYAPTDTNTVLYLLDYNPANYNGADYTDYNQTALTKGRLYSNNALVFARNLYNLTLNGGTATATIQVPNTLLNNVTIVQEDLIGGTNSVLVSQNENIQKNIYETLYINFIQSLNVIDEDENVTYPLTASYINQNINVGTQQNCEDTFAGKVVINYSNGQFTQDVLWAFNTDHYELSFIIDARSDSVTSFNLMSNDESTIYITKEVDLQSGNYYQIDLKLRIE